MPSAFVASPQWFDLVSAMSDIVQRVDLSMDSEEHIASLAPAPLLYGFRCALLDHMVDAINSTADQGPHIGYIFEYVAGWSKNLNSGWADEYVVATKKTREFGEIAMQEVSRLIAEVVHSIGLKFIEFGKQVS